MPFPNIDPIAFSIGPLAIHWYGLAYVAGILLGWAYARRIAANNALWPNNTSPISRSQLDDFIVWAALGIVLGGRIGYIFFYDLGAIIENPIRAVQIWNGGMSFHGGLTGTTIAMILFARRNRIPIWSLFDIVATVVPCGLFFGRIANFINGELWGRLTDVPWAVVFPTGGPFARHPSQLYEAGLEGIVLLLVLAALVYGAKALKSPGLITGVFVSRLRALAHLRGILPRAGCAARLPARHKLADDGHSPVPPDDPARPLGDLPRPPPGCCPAALKLPERPP